MRGRDEMDEKFLEALCAIKDPTFLRSPRRRPPSTPSAIVRGNLLSNSQAKGDETNAKLISHKGTLETSFMAPPLAAGDSSLVSDGHPGASSIIMSPVRGHALLPMSVIDFIRREQTKNEQTRANTGNVIESVETDMAVINHQESRQVQDSEDQHCSSQGTEPLTGNVAEGEVAIDLCSSQSEEDSSSSTLLSGDATEDLNKNRKKRVKKSHQSDGVSSVTTVPLKMRLRRYKERRTEEDKVAPETADVVEQLLLFGPDSVEQAQEKSGKQREEEIKENSGTAREVDTVSQQSLSRDMGKDEMVIDTRIPCSSCRTSGNDREPLCVFGSEEDISNSRSLPGDASEQPQKNMQAIGLEKGAVQTGPSITPLKLMIRKHVEKEMEVSTIKEVSSEEATVLSSDAETRPDSNISAVSLMVQPLLQVELHGTELTKENEGNEASSEASSTGDTTELLDLPVADSTETKQLSEEDTSCFALEDRKEMEYKEEPRKVKKKERGGSPRELQALCKDSDKSPLLNQRLRSGRRQRQDGQLTPTENITVMQKEEITSREGRTKSESLMLTGKHKSKKRETSPSQQENVTPKDKEMKATNAKSFGRIESVSIESSKGNEEKEKEECAETPEDDKKSCGKKAATVLCEWMLRFIHKTGSVCLEGLHQPSGVFWRSTSIVERLDAKHVTTKRGSVYVIKGPIDQSMMLEQGFSFNLTRAFQNGFPKNWKQIIQRHAESLKTIRGVKTGVGDTAVVETPVSSKPPSVKKVPRKPVSRVTGNLIDASTSDKSFSDTSMVVTSSGRRVRPVMHFWCNEHINVNKDGTAVVCSGSPNLLDFQPKASTKVNRKVEILHRGTRFRATSGANLTKNETRKAAVVGHVMQTMDDIVTESGCEVGKETKKHGRKKTSLKEDEQKVTKGTGRRGRPHLEVKKFADSTVQSQELRVGEKNKGKKEAQKESELGGLVQKELDGEGTEDRDRTKLLPRKRVSGHQDGGNDKMGVDVDVAAVKGGRKRVCFSSKRVEEDECASGQDRLTEQQKDEEESSDSEWSDTETQRLNRAVFRLPSGTANFWEKVSQYVGNRTAHECQAKHHGPISVRSQPKTVKSTAKEGYIELVKAAAAGQPVKLAGVGTLKRRRQLQALLEHEEHTQAELDLFDTTPFRNKIKKRESATVVDQDQSTEDDEKDASVFLTPHAYHIPGAPSSFTPHEASFRVDSPLPLRPGGRERLDAYVYKMVQRRKKGSRVKHKRKAAVHQKKTSKKQDSSGVAARQLAQVLSGRAFDVTPMSSPDSSTEESDEEQERDHYWGMT